jgi:NADH:ubiquinone oxidoreductase subunit F (NADH-binding)
VMSLAALCGLGQTASIPVTDTLKYFRKEYESRVEQSRYLRTLR